MRLEWRYLSVSALGASGWLGSTWLGANYKYAPFDWGVSDRIGTEACLLVAMAGGFFFPLLLCGAVFKGLGLPLVSRENPSYAAAPLLASWVALWVLGMFGSARWDLARTEAEFARHGVPVAAVVTDRGMRTIGNPEYGRQAEAVYFRYRTSDRYRDGWEWESEAQTRGRDRVDIVYSSRYPHVHRVR